VYALDRGLALVGIEIPAGFQRDVSSAHGARIQVINKVTITEK
jgi:hypothetical protein